MMKVLVADDDKLTRVYLKKLLSSWDYQVVLAEDGNRAWEELNRDNPPEIAILDWNMPGKTGVEICADCEEHGINVYRILFTERDADEDMMFALDQGAHDFHSKPISRGILKSRMAVGEAMIKARDRMLKSERLAAVGSLVAGVAHHFNNLNMPILMYASSILKNADLDPGIRKKVEKIEKAAEQAGHITEQLMSIASDKDQEKELTDLNRLVSDAIEIDSISYEKNNIAVESVFEEIPQVLISRNDIHHVVMNLMGNACDAVIASPEKKINVKTGKENSQVYIKISDSGCGIAKSKQHKIFTPFFSEKGEFAGPESPLSTVKGVGIGLFSAKNIAKDHEGDLTVESDVGNGSTFTLWLPCPEG